MFIFKVNTHHNNLANSFNYCSLYFFRLPYATIFGGVSAMTKDQFEQVNGFSNMFWGWGAEDDDLYYRIKNSGLHISRYPNNIARYSMLSHRKEKANPKR